MTRKLTCISLFMLLLMGLAQAQTPGTLTVTITTSETGGNYAPRNIVAVWVEDSAGDFVKTLLAYAQTRRTHLNTWEASTTAAGSPFNTVDAITGATRSSHGTRTCSWNGTDVNGDIVADGSYRLWMELTDKNGTGNFSSFEFSKDTLPLLLNPLNVPSFSAISINWEPVFTAVGEQALQRLVNVYPNPTSGIFTMEAEGLVEVVIRSTDGQLITVTRNSRVDLTAYPDGIYLLEIRTEKGTVMKKILKSVR